MKRIMVVLCAVTMAGCGSGSSSRKAAASVFPQSVGEWKLISTTYLAPAAVPDQIRSLGLKVAQSGEYEGSGHLTALICEMTSGAGAFEAEQKWQPVANTVGFHKNNYFIVIHWESADRAAVSSFVREMEKRL